MGQLDWGKLISRFDESAEDCVLQDDSRAWRPIYSGVGIAMWRRPRRPPDLQDQTHGHNLLSDVLGSSCLLPFHVLLSIT